MRAQHHGFVESVGKSAAHGFSKPTCSEIRLVEGLGVADDAHCGVTVRHRSRVAKDPGQPNLRQAHLIHSELFSELEREGFRVRSGDLGENITTRGVDLLALPRGTLLHLGASAIVEVTGLRTPCRQIDDFRTGLMHAVLHRTSEGQIIRKAGVMSIVRASGMVRAGDRILIQLPAGEHAPLEPV